MDTTAGLAERPLNLGEDLAIRVPDENYVVTISSPNARGVGQRPLSANIHLTRQEIQGQTSQGEMAPLCKYGIQHLY
jgi:hypothetical protein